MFNQLQNIERVIFVQKSDRWENVPEYSYQLSLTAWYLINSHNLSLDVNLVLKYALIHDIPEVYAGDPFFFMGNVDQVKQKQEKEAQAVKRLQTEFGEFTEFFNLIVQYETREDEESKFVYALDKVITMVNELISDGKSIKFTKTTREHYRKAKGEKVKCAPEIEEYYDLIMAAYDADAEKYYGVSV